MAAQRRPAGGGGGGGGSGPALLRVVSLHADAALRGPAFEVAMTDLLDGGGQPIDYPRARELFRREARTRCACVCVCGGGGAVCVCV